MPDTLEFVSLRLAAASGELSVLQWDGREHYKVPIVALVEGVLRPANSDQAELVLREEIEAAARTWNGRPTTQGHPQINGEYVSANHPRVYERETMGMTFDAEFTRDRLVLNSYIDPQRVREGSIGDRVLRRLKRHEPVEVSVGAFRRREMSSGTWKDGRTYDLIWREIQGDHIALLEEGDVGACSIDDGCGALRVAQRRDVINVVTDTGVRPEGGVMVVAQEKDAPKKSLRERFSDFFSQFAAASSDDVSDVELRDKLYRVLNAIEPGLLGVESVFPEAKSVVYATMPDPEQPPHSYRRAYSLADDGDVSVADDREEVKQVTTYEPVAAAIAGSCGCKHQTIAATTAKTEEGSHMDRTKKINDLLASGRYPGLSEADFNTISDVTLEKLSTEAITQPAPAAAQTNPTADVAKVTLDQLMEMVAPDVKAHLVDAKRITDGQRAAAIATLKKAGDKNTFTDDELAQMPLAQVEKLAKLVAEAEQPAAAQERGSIMNFAARGVSTAVHAPNEEAPPAPPDLVSLIQARRKV